MAVFDCCGVEPGRHEFGEGVVLRLGIECVGTGTSSLHLDDPIEIYPTKPSIYRGNDPFIPNVIDSAPDSSITCGEPPPVGGSVALITDDGARGGTLWVFYLAAAAAIGVVTATFLAARLFIRRVVS
jgi:hypothetical protein